MKKYLVKFYLDDKEKNPCFDSEIANIFVTGNSSVAYSLARELKRNINDNINCSYKCEAIIYQKTIQDRFTLALLNPVNNSRKWETYIIEDILEMKEVKL